MRRTTNSFIWVFVATEVFLCGCEPEADGAEHVTGYALAIGLNELNPTHYGGWRGELSGCEPDAMDMKQIADSQGLKTDMLLTKDATRAAVLSRLDALAEKLEPGDLLIVSYSGHGGQIPDQNGDETDGLDETWCLYDGQLLDDELHGSWMKFKAGVRILAFSDSCHSGTVLKMKKADMENPPASRTKELDEMWERLRVPPKLDRTRMLSLPEMREAIPKRPYLRERVRSLPPSAPQPNEPERPQAVAAEVERVFVSRSMPPGASMRAYSQNRAFYDELGKSAPPQDSGQVEASVILISACDDPQAAADLGFNGLFTWTLKKIWNSGTFTGDHLKFYEEIREGVKQQNPDQTPTMRYVGAFIGQRPYTVE